MSEEILNDGDRDEEVITLMADSGEEIDFYEIASIEYEQCTYAILQPLELLEGMDDDEALVFKVTHCGDDEADKFEIELDDGVIDAVFSEYTKLLDEIDPEEEN